MLEVIKKGVFLPARLGIIAISKKNKQGCSRKSKQNIQRDEIKRRTMQRKETVMVPSQYQISPRFKLTQKNNLQGIKNGRH